MDQVRLPIFTLLHHLCLLDCVYRWFVWVGATSFLIHRILCDFSFLCVITHTEIAHTHPPPTNLLPVCTLPQKRLPPANFLDLPLPGLLVPSLVQATHCSTAAVRVYLLPVVSFDVCNVYVFWVSKSDPWIDRDRFQYIVRAPQISGWFFTLFIETSKVTSVIKSVSDEVY